MALVVRMFNILSVSAGCWTILNGTEKCPSISSTWHEQQACCRSLLPTDRRIDSIAGLQLTAIEYQLSHVLEMVVTAPCRVDRYFERTEGGSL